MPRLFTLAGLTLLLASCASAPTRFHTLDPVPPAAAPAARTLALPIQLESVTVPPELDRPQVVRRAGPGKLDLSDDDHWAGALDELARAVLATELAARLPPGATVKPDDPAPPKLLRHLDVVIERFEGAVGGPTVTLVADWTLLGTGGNQALARHEERIEVPAGPDMDGTITAMSAALGQLADRIAAALG